METKLVRCNTARFKPGDRARAFGGEDDGRAYLVLEVVSPRLMRVRRATWWDDHWFEALVVAVYCLVALVLYLGVVALRGA